MNVKVMFAAVVLLLAQSVTKAQDSRSSISAYAGGGIQSFSFDINNGSVSPGMGFVVGGIYQYSMTPNWGIIAGLDLSRYSSSAKFSFMESTKAFDSENNLDYELRTHYTDLKGKQNAMFVGIPVGFTYKTPINSKLTFVSALGVRLLIPVSSKYKTTGGTIETKGYYEAYNVELENLPQHGFKAEEPSFSGDIKLKMGGSLFADAGVAFNVSSRALYAGLYGGYGLVDMSMKSDPLVSEEFAYKGLFNSSHANNIRTYSVGIKVGISVFCLKKKEQKQIVEPEPFLVEEVEEVEPVEPVEAKPIEAEPVAVPIEDNSQIENEEAEIVEEELDDDSAISLEQAQNMAQIISSSMKFNIDSFEPDKDDNSSACLDSLAILLKSNSSIKLHIYGHTCDLGSQSTNEQVGQGRADFIKKLLLDRGVAENQLIAENKGASEPIVPNNSDDNRAKNRRVKLVVE